MITRTPKEWWERFKRYYFRFPKIGLALDLSRMNFPGDFFESMASPMQRAFAAMADLERGAIANPDENRMVGHYWLRNPALAPTAEIRTQIENTIRRVKEFADSVHSGRIRGDSGPFRNVLLIGIGGSALGPQFVSHALGHPQTDKMRVFFFDNTDPDGMDRTLYQIRHELGQTLCIVTSKSGKTIETRNGMLEAQAAYKRNGLNFSKYSVAVTCDDSELDIYARSNGWLARFPMWDWVGGRTSELSAVGLLPAALQGIEIDSIILGAKDCDTLTRENNVNYNPSALLAMMWYYIGNGNGSKNMVVIPYKDRLELLTKYLQQLIMESIGRERDLDGNIVNQGLTVLGNKGSTDQHSIIQQLVHGQNSHFVTFVEILKDREAKSMNIEEDTTTGDYLSSFLHGTRLALTENGRESITITCNMVTPYTIGVLIALFERAVGFYASLININPYNQPGVEAGKKAANKLISLQKQVYRLLSKNPGKCFKIPEICLLTGNEDNEEAIFKILEHLLVNHERGIHVKNGENHWDGQYYFE